MKIISKLSEITGNKPLVVTVGNFDGVHLGHRKLMGAAQSAAKKMDGHLVVTTFIPHPQDFFSNFKGFYLNTFEERRDLLNDFGIEYLLEINFDDDFRNLSPEAFLNDYILKDKRVNILYLGHDFSFGKSKSGNLDFVRKFISKTEVTLEVLPEYTKAGEKISSSLIRDLIREGNVNKANELLGREFFIRGKVVKGMGKGATIEVPTINLEVDPKRVIPARGVYFTKTLFQGSLFESVTNIGHNPTASDNKELKIETHILEFSKQIYGQEVVLFFLKKLREEKKFHDFEELRKQIKTDIKERMNYR